MTDNEIKIIGYALFVFLVIAKIIIICGSIRNSMIAHKQIKHLNKCLDDQKEMIDYLLDKKPKPPKNRIIKNGKIK